MATKTFVEDRFRRTMDRSKIVTGGRFLLVGSLAVGLLSGVFLYGTLKREQSQGNLAEQGLAVEALLAPTVLVRLPW